MSLSIRIVHPPCLSRCKCLRRGGAGVEERWLDFKNGCGRREVVDAEEGKGTQVRSLGGWIEHPEVPPGLHGPEAEWREAAGWLGTL